MLGRSVKNHPGGSRLENTCQSTVQNAKALHARMTGVDVCHEPLNVIKLHARMTGFHVFHGLQNVIRPTESMISIQRRLNLAYTKRFLMGHVSRGKLNFVHISWTEIFTNS